MRVTGTLKKWNDERGFGFLETDETGVEVFVHVKSFAPRGARPQIGETFFFDIAPGPAGKRRATNVERVQVARARMAVRRESPRRRVSPALLAIPAFVFVYGIASHLWKPPGWIALVYLIASVVTFLVYALDKRAARLGRWRVEEGTLHAFALAGGWPGALLAQQFLRHKSAKVQFLIVFWITALLNTAGFVVLCHWLAQR
ncbi:cold shock and DUF1294 domain-containing protein [Tahibacter sp.]|uniref:cold shock and DUF1294 domain-containing protein n=1 Tax=Tahibacter sp. TaxID=2056211 RepID=UPI0028C38099|nr:cold shock and DUF1294 domain-containing protein [Tahibacter sp.]